MIMVYRVILKWSCIIRAVFLSSGPCSGPVLEAAGPAAGGRSLLAGGQGLLAGGWGFHRTLDGR